MKKIHSFLYLSAIELKRKLTAWAEDKKLDRNLASPATKKGHIHRIGTGKIRAAKMIPHPRPKVLGRNMRQS